ncbi:MAG: hypothetical protein FWD61_09100 [Phycisphaerales bacterium]|nr:hypothetical protein [Phycisphaerales bacterium]
MRFASLALVLSLSLTTAAIPACRSNAKDAPLIAAPSFPIADVPIPAGFAMMKKVSTSKVVPGATRFVDHQYSGSDDFLPVVKFYQDQMPGQKWTLVEQNQGNASVTLHFTKGSEDCVVSVTDGDVFTPTRIRVRIDPMARNQSSNR